jgi:hypothetical protein
MDRVFELPARRGTLAVLATFAAAVTVVMLAPPARSAPAMAMSGAMGASMPSMAGMSLRQRFDYLSRQHTNSCMLQTSGFASMNQSTRLQGACCGPMAYADYAKQIPAIASYNRNHHTSNVLASDPYNMSVAFVQHLNAFNDQILLTNAQMRVYDAAWQYAGDKAPCCCHCYRWTAFEGQAKYLIARRRYTAREVGEVWTLDDGCGSTGAAGAGMGMG